MHLVAPILALKMFISAPSCPGSTNKPCEQLSPKSPPSPVDGSLKSGVHQLRLVVEIPLFLGFQHHPNGGWDWDFFPINSSAKISCQIFKFQELEIEVLGPHSFPMTDSWDERKFAYTSRVVSGSPKRW